MYLFFQARRGVIKHASVGLLLSFAMVANAETSNKTLTDLVTNGDKGSEVQLEVRQMPLAKVLDSVAQQTKIPIHYSVLPEGVVTATCVGTHIKKVLECLLDHKADLIVRYSKNANKADVHSPIVEAWVLGSKLEAVANTQCVQSTTSNGSMSLNRKEPERASKNDPTDSLLKIATSDNTTARAEAIGSLLALGRKDDPETQRVLENALHDQDANVRAQAVSTLVHRDDYNENAKEVIQEALQDDSVDVRLMAVDGITDDIGLLQQAVNDSDETISSLATIKLQELMQQQAKQN